MPHDPEEHVYAVLRSAVATADAEVSADRTCSSIMAGDWDAALLEGDSPVLTSDGSACQGLIVGYDPDAAADRTSEASHTPTGRQRTQLQDR